MFICLKIKKTPKSVVIKVLFCFKFIIINMANKKIFPVDVQIALSPEFSRRNKTICS